MEGREMREKTQHAQSLHHKLGFAATCDQSPKWDIHKLSTPKNKVRTAKNPFEPLLHEVMHTNIMSPSVFAALPNKAPVADDKFCWSIEELATFQPIDIEKSPFVQSEATDHVMEAVAQAKINKFFSAKTILPSPAGPTALNKPSISTSISNYPISPLAITPSPPSTCSTFTSTDCTRSDQSSYISQQQQQLKRRKLCASIASQTYLSLPPVLPVALENMLRSYMQPDGKLMNDLYPDGYSSGEDEENKNCSPPKAIHDLSPLANSPPLHKPAKDRSSDSDSFYNDPRSKNHWQLSPIAAQDDENSGGSGTTLERYMMRSRRSVAKLDFSVGHMSVDMSIPTQLCCSSNDLLDGLSFHNETAHLGNTPPKKGLNYSFSSPSPCKDEDQNISVNNSSFSRMEDDCVTFHRSRSFVIPSPSMCNLDMDISFSNTPKSRSASATRRRLCDSFASFGDDEDEENEANKEEKVDENGDAAEEGNECVNIVETGSCKADEDNLIRKHDEVSSLTDAGYNTASTFEESSICFDKNSHLFASTPTKTKKIFFPINE